MSPSIAFARGRASSTEAARVNAVSPGPVWTPLNPADKEAEKVAEFGSHTPMRRPAQPEEIAPAYVFLASPRCFVYYRRNPADHRRLYRRVRAGVWVEPFFRGFCLKLVSSDMGSR